MLEQKQAEAMKLKQQLQARSHVDVSKCYQCGKCTAGCPVAEHMDIMPRQVIRLVQLGMMEQAMKSKAIWLCATCETCSTRCPKGVEIATVMETLRIMAKEKGYISEKNVDKFHDVYVGIIKHFGRMYEAGLIVGRNVTTGKLFQDTSYGIPYLTKQKIEILPYRPKETGEMKGIFERAKIAEERGKHE